MFSRRIILRFFLGLLILGLIALVLFYRYRDSSSASWFDWQTFLVALQEIDKKTLAVALLALFSTYFIRALRWQQLTRPVAKTRLKNLVVATIIGYTSVFLLGRPAEVVRPVLIARKEKLRISAMLGVVLFERIQDFLAVFFWMGFGLLMLPVESASTAGSSELLQATRQGGWLALGASVVIMSLLLIWRWHSEKFLRWVEEVLRFLPRRAHLRVSDFLRSFSEGWKSIEHNRILLATFGYSLLIWFLVIEVYYLTCRSVGGGLAEISFGGATILLAVGILGSILLIPGVGGGHQAATFVTLTTLFGVGVEVAAGLSVLLWLLTFAAIAVVGIPLMVHEGLSLGELRAMSRTRGGASGP